MFKKVLFLAIVIFAVANLQAQNYTISFAGTGAATTVESVEVTNVTQNKSLTIAGTDVLNLVASITGIEDKLSNGANGLNIYPNPMTDASNIQFEMQSAGEVNIQLFDITGKQVAVLQNNLNAGVHNFSVNNLSGGVYTVLVGCDGKLYSQKIVSLNSGVQQATINYVGISSNRVTKNTKATVQMQYNTGDQLSLKGISGTYNNVVLLTPTQSSTVTFTFVAAANIIDGSGNIYTTVVIGTQTWLKENLKTTKYIDGTDIANVTIEADWAVLTTAAYCWYNNDIANKDIYGGLYNWYAVDKASNGDKNICPTGYHVSTDVEWSTLMNYLGGDAGGKMKEIGTTHWKSPNTGATNESGFTGLPSGSRDSNSGAFDNVGYGGYFWSSTAFGASNAWYRYLYYDNASCDRYDYSRKYGFSVRCLKD